MIAWLLPLASFAVICVGYSVPQLLGLRVRYATQKVASYIAVGAIVILFLFGLMLTKAPIGRDTLDNQQRWLGAIIGAGVFAGLVFLIQDAFPMQDAQAFEPVQGTTDVVGDAIFRNYVLPFEAVSFLLLAALIGAIVLARKDDST